jgi:hypothetical protein
MKQSITKYKLSKIPKSKYNKINFEASLKAKNLFSKIKNDSLNRETLDRSCADNILLNQTSLNDSKTTFGKNNSLGKINTNKIMVFTSSLKYPFEFKNRASNKDSKTKFHNFELSDENLLNEEINFTLKQNDGIELGEHCLDEDDTDRIDYRYYPKIPQIESTKENKYYWLATYDKLMKKSKIIKILNYYSEVGYNTKENQLSDEQFNFKEKSMIIHGFEIYFLENFNKPFIRPKQGGKIFIKLYLLNIEQINKIFSYINRLEYKDYINDLDIIREKNLFKDIIHFNKSIYNYSTLFCLGSFMNINIYLFSHIEKNKKEEKKNLNELPSSSKLAKLIKVLMLNFPDYTKKDFINYLTNFLNDNSCTVYSLEEKKREVSNLLTSVNKKNLKLSTKNKFNTNSVIKNIIKKIPTYTSCSLNTPDEFNNFSESNNINNNSEIYRIKYKKNLKLCDSFNSKTSRIKIKNTISEKILTKIDSDYFYSKNKRIKSNIPQIKKDFILKNNMNTLDCKSFKCRSKKLDILSRKINNTKLMNPIKKSLTRNNTNMSNTYHIKLKSNLNNENQVKKNKFVNYKLNFIKKLDDNKENNPNILNTYLQNNIKFKTDIGFKNSNNNTIKTEMNKQNTRNRILANFNPFYDTNTINTNNNIFNGKKPKRVISSIRKIISQKLSNISENSMTIFKNTNINNSNYSLYGNNNNGNIFNYKNLSYASKNNSKNKTSEYITPRKKRFYYYYH